MPRKSEKLYISQTEHAGGHGKAASLSSAATQSQYQNYVPFSCCAISLQPWSTPVADRNDGTIYELTNVLPWIQKHGLSPASGGKLAAGDLVPLHFSKNEATGQWHDPVSFKAFNDSTHLVAVATTGNVFAHDTVHQLNVKAKYWSDLVSGEAFTRKDILTLQDPNNVSGRKKAADLHHLKEKLTLSAAEKDAVNIAATGSAGSLLKKLKEQKEGAKREKDEAGEKALAKMEAARKESARGKSDTTTASSTASSSKSQLPSAQPKLGRSTGMTAASLTSSGLDIRTKTDREIISLEDTMYDEIRKGYRNKKGALVPHKGYVRLVTNFGPLNVELHCDRAPRTCYNFLTLCAKGKYTDTIFHRNIPGFMIQGGDPTGTGTGGQSMWGKPFADELTATPGSSEGHSARGCLSMANRGPDTNTSQFFFTYAPKTHLDRKHTVFGRLVDEPSATLDALEAVPTDPATDRPLRTVRILDVQVFSDPFADWMERRDRKEARGNEGEVARREEKRKRREEDRTTWFGTNVKEGGAEGEDASTAAIAATKGGVGRYLAAAGVKKPVGTAGRIADDDNVALPDVKKRKKGPGDGASASFGDFSGW